jgi:hypothetical protein
MITRRDYMAKRVTFAAFYRAVNATARLRLDNAGILDRVRAALANGDDHLNSIPLPIWDSIAATYRAELARALRAHGDFYSLAIAVCCLKQCAIDQIKGA